MSFLSRYNQWRRHRAMLSMANALVCSGAEHFAATILTHDCRTIEVTAHFTTGETPAQRAAHWQERAERAEAKLRNATLYWQDGGMRDAAGRSLVAVPETYVANREPGFVTVLIGGTGNGLLTLPPGSRILNQEQTP